MALGTLTLDQLYPPPEIEAMYKRLAGYYWRGRKQLDEAWKTSFEILNKIPRGLRTPSRDEKEYTAYCDNELDDNLNYAIGPWFFAGEQYGYDQSTDAYVQILKNSLVDSDERKTYATMVQKTIESALEEMKDHSLRPPPEECLDHIDANLWEYMEDQLRSAISNIGAAGATAGGIARWKETKKITPTRYRKEVKIRI